MTDRRHEIDPRFYRGDRKPIVHTVQELRECLADLPDDLPIDPPEGGAALIVYNIRTNPFLAIEEGEDWADEEE